MDINDARIIMTVVGFVTFLGIAGWAYSGRRKKDFEEAARMALEEDEPTKYNGSGN
jgi:cytochrome c oxidase cbb3-type subunit 4